MDVFFWCAPIFVNILPIDVFVKASMATRDWHGWVTWQFKAWAFSMRLKNGSWDIVLISSSPENNSLSHANLRPSNLCGMNATTVRGFYSSLFCDQPLSAGCILLPTLYFSSFHLSGTDRAMLACIAYGRGCLVSTIPARHLRWLASSAPEERSCRTTLGKKTKGSKRPLTT